MIKSLKIFNYIALFVLATQLLYFTYTALYIGYHIYYLEGVLYCVENYPNKPSFNIFTNSCYK